MSLKPKVDPSALIAQSAEVIGDVQIGKGCSILPKAVLRGDVAPIRVGDCTNIQDNCVVHVSEDAEVVIGDHVTVGHSAILHSCKIGSGTLVGMGSIILDGAIVGKNVLVGAGALITKNKVIPDGVLVLGSPAKVARKLTEEDLEYLSNSAQDYIDTAKRYKDGEIESYHGQETDKNS